jgi:hypothetical protein
MRLLATLLLFCALWITSGSPAHAQRFTTKGTDFWLAFMEAYDPGTGVELSVAITAEFAATGTLSLPLAGWSQPFTIAAGGSIVITIPQDVAMVMGSENSRGQGIHVESDKIVAVFALSYTRGSADAMTVFPTPVLGSDYTVLSYKPFFNVFAEPPIPYPSQFAIVGVADGTTVEITPSAVTYAGHTAGVPFTVTVNAGEVYQVQSDEDLTGSRVRTTGCTSNCQTFALLSGVKFAVVGVQRNGMPCGFADHLVEQMYPNSTWGIEYITMPFQSRLEGDIVRVLAAQDGTTYTINGGTPITLNRGEFRDTLLATTSYITADKPVAVGQYARGRQCDDILYSDPFMVMLSPVRQSLESMIFTTFTPTQISGYYLDLTIKSSDVATVVLDGNPISASFSPLAANPLYSIAQLSVTAGQHVITSNCGVTAMIYAFGSSISYGYSAGASLENIASAEITHECTCNGILLSAPLGMGPYRWSTGDTTRSIEINASGDYSVQLLKQWGCDATTQPPPLPILLERPAELRLEPSTIEATAGTTVPLQLHIAGARYSIGCGRDSVTFALRFNRTLLAPPYIEGTSIIHDTIIGIDRILTIRTSADTTLLLELVAALGNVESTLIVLDSLGWDSCPPTAQATVLGKFQLSGICREGGVRLFEANDELFIKPVRPDPAASVAEIEYGIVEPGWTEISLVNSVGQRVLVPAEGLMLPGRYLLSLDVSQLPSGTYHCVLRTRTQQIERSLRVVK